MFCCVIKGDGVSVSRQCGETARGGHAILLILLSASSCCSTPSAEVAPPAMMDPRQDKGFIAPERLLRTVNDMPKFLASRACKSLVEFIRAINTASQGAKLSDECIVSPLVQRLLDTLNTMEGWCEEYPPSQQQMRYGNVAFREWHNRLLSSATDLVRMILPEEYEEAVVELVPYLCESFGNATRIDYGTGHENTFVAFLVCLSELGLVTKDDHKALAMRVFAKYIILMRKIQMRYRLEPAGSQGVWGLDDYCFLPFYWGASQLLHHEIIKPSSIHVNQVLQTFGDEYMYLSSVQFVKQVKKGNLGETSPMLNDISAVLSWEKINTGLLKMYKAECLGKFQIMQHFLFGSILTLEENGGDSSHHNR